jgi:hypothetical protein
MDVREVGEDRGIEAAGADAAHPLVAEAVVARPLVGVGEHRIGFGRLLEALFRSGVAGVPVGMEFLGHLAIGRLDLLRAGRLADAEHLVVITFCHV